MQLNAKMIAVLADIALHTQVEQKGRVRVEHCVRCSDISQRLGIPLSTLEILLSRLLRLGLLHSHKGPGGGYVLAHAPQHITLAQFLKVKHEGLLADVMTQLLEHNTLHDVVQGVQASEVRSQTPCSLLDNPSVSRARKASKLKPRRGTPNSVFALGACSGVRPAHAGGSQVTTSPNSRPKKIEWDLWRPSAEA